MSEAANHRIQAIGAEKLRGHLAMITFAALIAGSFSFGRLALPYVDPAPLNAMRYVIAVAVMAGYTFGIRGHKFSVPEAPWRFLILGGLMAFYFVSMFIALTMTSPVSTSAVFTLTPVMTAIFGLFLLGQTFGALVVLSLFIAATGSIWVIFDGDVEALLGFRIGQGELIYFCGCVAHALFAPLLRKFNRGEAQSYMTFFILVGTALCIAAYGLPQILATNWLSLPLIAWAAIAYLAVFTGVITFMLMQYASTRLPASKVLSYGYLVPCFVILYEGLSGNGWVTASVAAGAVVTGLGLVVLYFSPDQ